MPELPELQALAEGLARATRGRPITRAIAWQPATLKSAEPPLEALVGTDIDGVWRRGKLIGVDAGEVSLVVHLMQAGRLGLVTTPTARPGRQTCLDVHLDGGTVLRLRELSTERRASAHVVARVDLARHPALAALGPEPIGLGSSGWRSALAAPPARVHTALRDGRRVAGIGRAYASEIMWAARLAPFARTDRLDGDAWARLAAAADAVLGQALERARERISTDLPNAERRVTAVHRHHGEPCLRCGTRLARVGFVEYELVYCPTCQTGGKVYADRRTSRFLR